MSPSPRLRAALLAAAALSLPLTAAHAASPPAAQLGAFGVDFSGADRATRPGDNFDRFVNGHFEDTTTIPPDRTSIGSFVILSIRSEQQVHDILEAAASAPTPATAKIGDLYAAFMDAARIEALGAAPLAGPLKAISDASSREALAALMGAPGAPYGALFGLSIEADEKSPDRYAVYSRSTGLGLPDKDYYLKSTFAEARAKYQAYIAKMLTLAGWPNAEAAAADVLAFETRLAEASWDRAEFRDPDKTYNPVTPDELAALAPGFAFAPELEAAGLGKVGRIILSDKTAFPKKAAIFAETPLPTLKAWMAFGVIDTLAGYLPNAFDEAHFAFRSKVLSGQPEQPVRWKRGVSLVDAELGELVGAVYVQKHFPASSRAKMEGLVADLRTSLGARIDRLDWMSAKTKAEAKAKLAKFHVKIGYPDRFRDYAEVEIRRDDLVGDVLRAEAADWRRDLARLDKPVDRAEWDMTPQTVNAYYNPTFNEIVFPAAILQPPFFDPNADAAVNYGAIGAVIGHEISHGFDDQGRKSDGDGALKDWWTAEDAERFNARAARLAAQYDAIEPLPGEHINGKLTLGENIGDLGGINIALDAYHAHLGDKSAPMIDGFTGDQRFFLGYAQIWRSKFREEALRQRLHTDPHSPGQARVDAVVRNVDGWYDAFGVKPGDALYLSPADRVKIW